MKLTQHACYAEQLKRLYCTAFSNVNNYSRREKLYCPRSTLYGKMSSKIMSEVDQLQLLMDNTIKVKPTKKNSVSVARLEGLSRRLMFKLHIKRTKLLQSDRDKIQTTMKKRN